MIRGVVIGLEARIPVRLQAGSKRYQTIETIFDSGFTDWVALPAGLVAALGLRWKSEGRGTLADGSESRFDIYDATVQWHGRARRIPVYAIGTAPLIGMGLVYGSEWNMKIRPGGPVTIKPLRRRRRRS